MGIQVTQEFAKILTTPNTKLIIGLGNSGEKYTNTRHNAGFLAIDALNMHDTLGTFTHKKKLYSDVVEGRIGQTKVIAAKPTTFMNISGKAVLALQDYYKLDASQILIIHDDIDLEFSKIRTRKGGGTGGHNGLKSIDNAIGDEYTRIKIGISNEYREKIDASDFVLQQFTKDELLQLQHAWPKVIDLIHTFIESELEATSLVF